MPHPIPVTEATVAGLYGCFGKFYRCRSAEGYWPTPLIDAIQGSLPRAALVAGEAEAAEPVFMLYLLVSQVLVRGPAAAATTSTRRPDTR
jgi:hypothetical protein